MPKVWVETGNRLTQFTTDQVNLRLTWLITDPLTPHHTAGFTYLLTQGHPQRWRQLWWIPRPSAATLKGRWCCCLSASFPSVLTCQCRNNYFCTDLSMQKQLLLCWPINVDTITSVLTYQCRHNYFCTDPLSLSAHARNEMPILYNISYYQHSCCHHHQVKLCYTPHQEVNTGILGEIICSKRLTDRQSPNMVLIVTMMWSSITASDVQQVTWSLGETTL